LDAPDFGAVLDCSLYQGTTSVVPQTAQNKGWALQAAKKLSQRRTKRQGMTSVVPIKPIK
jgi:hypothetical protein